MIIVATNKINRAKAQYPAASMHLDGLYHILRQGEFRSEQQLRATFGDMRGFNFQYSFPVPETNLLVDTLINFESQVAFIDDIKPGNQ